MEYMKHSPIAEKYKDLVKKKNIHSFTQTSTYMELEFARLFLEDQHIVFSVFPTLYVALQVYEQLSEKEDVYFFGADEFISAQLLSASPELLLQRIATIESLVTAQATNKKIWIITHVAAVTRPIMLLEEWKKNTLSLHVGNEIRHQDLTEHLASIGYERVATVEKMGDFAVRGEVIDVFSPKYEKPVRLSFFDTEIEMIYFFDDTTQKTTSRVDEVILIPMVDTVAHSNHSILSYFESPVILEHQNERIRATYEHMLADAQQFEEKNTEIVGEQTHRLFIPYEEIVYGRDKTYTFSQLSEGQVAMHASALFAETIQSKEALLQEMTIYIQQDYAFILLIGEHQEKKIREGLEKALPFLLPEKVQVREDIGFNEVWEDEHILIINADDLLEMEKHKVQKRSKVFGKIDVEAQVHTLEEIQPGDYVVHVNHGIARYDGVKTIMAQGVERDYIVLSYDQDETIYLPVEKVDLLYRYTAGKEGFIPKRSSLNSKSWKKRTEKVQEHVDEFAQELFQIYMERERIKGFQFSPDTARQKLFEAEFPYNETEDQIEAIKEIKKDMEAPYIMERLLCGDVGFGKTEVAFRAAFKAIEDGKQVILLAPTTILVKQHYENALKRFANYGTRIGMLSRLVSKKEQQRVLFDLEVGELDLLIGTHRVLSNDVKVDKLGLVIIDEEHRFGVAAKERFKKFRTEVDVLMISATPIPRTLQMSVTGIRDLSLLQTAPHNRYPVQTYVVEQNDQLIRDAIERELSRGGQTYFLYNKVKSIDYMTDKIRKLIPDARVDFAHGQMTKTQLEDMINQFVDKELDVLVSTTIIENGMDIPNANTLIIYEADVLGLAQLYQLRGRVGRSDRIAYSYFMYNGRNMLTEDATKRLQTIQSFTEFGSGYHIAMRDLAIRGAGDVLGKTQSGFINDVGFDLYIDMLQSAISRQQSVQKEGDIATFEQEKHTKTMVEKMNDGDGIEVSFSVPAYIPSSYIMDESVKIEIYQMLDTINSLDIMWNILDVLKDRFGAVPEAIDVLAYTFLLRKTAKQKNVQFIRQVRNKVLIKFTKSLSKSLNRLLVNQTITRAGYQVEIQYQADVLTISIITMRKEVKDWLEEILDVIDIVNASVSRKKM